MLSFFQEHRPFLPLQQKRHRQVVDTGVLAHVWVPVWVVVAVPVKAVLAPVVAHVTSLVQVPVKVPVRAPVREDAMADVKFRVAVAVMVPHTKQLRKQSAQNHHIVFWHSFIFYHGNNERKL